MYSLTIFEKVNGRAVESISEKHFGSCHCGSVQFEVQLTDSFNTTRRCSCSYCGMRGAIAVTANLDGISITKGEEMLTLYQFNTNTAKHYFCSACGIYTHHQRRSDPTQYGINVACLDNISPFDFAEVTVDDGINHPSDHSSEPGIAGVLRFSRS